jgi:hypothetical protein
VKFHSPAGDGFLQMQSQAFFYFGANDTAFRRTFADVGLIMKLADA